MWKCKIELRRLRRAIAGRGRPIVHFLHVRKTGGNAINAALAPHRTSGTFRIELHSHSTTMNDVPVGTPFFFVVRDPVDRYVSGFYSRQRQGQPRNSQPWTPLEAIAFERFSTANELAEAIGRDPQADAAMASIGHVRSSYWDWFHDVERSRAQPGPVRRDAHRRCRR